MKPPLAVVQHTPSCPTENEIILPELVNVLIIIGIGTYVNCTTAYLLYENALQQIYIFLNRCN